MTQVTKTMIGTHVVECRMTAAEALEIELLTADPTCSWFARWAMERPNDDVFMYAFGGFIGGFIFGERGDFNTLTEFAECADMMAQQVWDELRSV